RALRARRARDPPRRRTGSDLALRPRDGGDRRVPVRSRQAARAGPCGNEGRGAAPRATRGRLPRREPGARAAEDALAPRARRTRESLRAALARLDVSRARV